MRANIFQAALSQNIATIVSSIVYYSLMIVIISVGSDKCEIMVHFPSKASVPTVAANTLCNRRSWTDIHFHSQLRCLFLVLAPFRSTDMLRASQSQQTKPAANDTIYGNNCYYYYCYYELYSNITATRWFTKIN